MKSNLSKTSAQKAIDKFFQRKRYSSEEVKKTRRLAMKYKIKLSVYRKFFCKKCLNKLAGRISITKTHKTVVCLHCGFKNKFRI